MNMSGIKILFISTLVILGIGIGLFFIHEQSSHKATTKVIPNVQALVTKYRELQLAGEVDLSSDEDLTVAIMNLLGIEEHLFFTGAKTKKSEYYDLIDEVREVRKVLLKKLIPQYEGEVWCVSKHLLAASYRLMETGTKQLHNGNKQEAYELFEQGYKLYLLFWKINKSISPITNDSQAGLVSDVGSKNKPVHGNDTSITPKSCVFDGSKINCCAE